MNALYIFPVAVNQTDLNIAFFLLSRSFALTIILEYTAANYICYGKNPSLHLKTITFIPLKHTNNKTSHRGQTNMSLVSMLTVLSVAHS